MTTTANIEEELPVTFADYQEAAQMEEPDPADYGVWVPGIPVLVSDWLREHPLRRLASGADPGRHRRRRWRGIGLCPPDAGSVPATGLPGKLRLYGPDCLCAGPDLPPVRSVRQILSSPCWSATGCGVPGIMASRTIENDRDRKMTIMTTTFIPCGAKLPIIALICRRALWRRLVGGSQRLLHRHRVQSSSPASF